MFTAWLKRQNKILRGDPRRSIKPKRKYPHFDNRIRTVTPELAKKISNPVLVASHEFYPFLTYTKLVRKRKKGKKFEGYTKKQRPICYAGHYDTLLFSWYAHLLYDLYEQEIQRLDLSTNILAYRSGNGSNVDHACIAFRAVQDMNEANIVCADISGFFENLQHSGVKQMWLRLLKIGNRSIGNLPDDHYQVFKNITKYATIEVDRAYESLGYDLKQVKKKPPLRLCSPSDFREKIANKGLIRKNLGSSGIPQGSSISAIIANFYMLDFDQRMKAAVERIGGVYYRYSDDVFVGVPANTLTISDIEQLLQSEVSSVGLDINDSKNETYLLRNEKGIQTVRNSKTSRKKGLNYLGMSFDGRDVLFKHGSLANYQRKALSAVRTALRYHFREGKPVPKRNINSRFTKLGKQNFQSYVRRAVNAVSKHGFRTKSLQQQASDFFVHKAVRSDKIRNAVIQQVARRKVRQQRRRFRS